MSAYFGHGIICNCDADGFYQLKCLTAQCKKCKLILKFSTSDFDIPDKVHYLQFELEEYSYKNKEGEEKIGKRTTLFTKTDSFAELKCNFHKKCTLYLLHRYECLNNKFLWPQILEASPGFIFHVDYSENISVTPKFEPQDAHFPGNQTSLHCAAVHSPHNANVQYAYHLSDNKKCDFTFTGVVICDLIAKFNVPDDKFIRIKSDNCGSQYCSLHVFEGY